MDENTIKEMKEDEWICPECGTKNTGKFCSECGHKKSDSSDETKEDAHTPEETAKAVEEKTSAEQPAQAVSNGESVVNAKESDEAEVIPPSISKESVKGIKEKESPANYNTALKILACIGAACIILAIGFAGGTLATNSRTRELEQRVASLESRVDELENSDDIYSWFGNAFGNDGDDRYSQLPFGDEEDTDSSEESSAGLGVTVQETEDGVMIAGIYEGSNAADAGIEFGDIVTSIDGIEVSSLSEIRAILAEKQPGDEVELVLLRDSENITVTIELVDLNEVSGNTLETSPFIGQDNNHQ